jgi:tripartite ATP-independent transporter DctM subunit
MELGLYILIFVFALMGTPIYAVMTLISAVAFTFAEIDHSAIAVEIYRMAAAPTLLTIPLFTFAGYLMAESKSPQRLLKLAHSALGWLPGGVAIVSLIICAFFTAFTGASGVTIIALGGLLYPMLLKEKYDEEFTLGLITTSGSLGLLFPPSLPIILYGIVAKVDIDKLFLAGIVPGTLLIVILSAYSVFKGNQLTRSKFSWVELKEGIKSARYEIPLPFIVLGGIYSGSITPTEASAICALYVIIIECFLYRDLDLFKDVPRITKESMSLVGAILIILCCALGLTNYLVDEEIPLKILDLMRELISDKYVFLLFLNLFLLVVGAMMDIFSAIIVVVPIILPIAEEFGVDPIHLAIIFLTNLEIGYITPPVGINLFISSFRFDKSVLYLYKVAIPYLILLIIALLLITYIPWLTLLWF